MSEKTLTQKEVRNGAYNLSHCERRHEVRCFVQLNPRTRDLSDLEQERVIDRIWRKIKGGQ